MVLIVANAVTNIWYNRVVMAHDENLEETQTESESKMKASRKSDAMNIEMLYFHVMI